MLDRNLSTTVRAAFQKTWMVVVNELLDQIEKSLEHKFYFLSLYATLTVPDAAGALESENFWATPDKYVSWFDTWVRPRMGDQVLARMPPQVLERMEPKRLGPLDGAACYQFRCSLLHQGSTIRKTSPFDRIMFIEPNTSSVTIHNSMSDNSLVLDLPMFCSEVVDGARAWLKSMQGNEVFACNVSKSARRYPDGLPPHISGVPVIS